MIHLHLLSPVMINSVLISTIFLSSLIGSIHCVGMCGGFSVWAHQMNGVLTYHVGRLAGYLGLGVIAGVIGDATFNLISPVYQVGIGVGLGVVILVTGVRTLFAPLAIRRVPKIVALITDMLIPELIKKSRGLPIIQGFVLGIGSILLPCGWLYSFLMAGAATGSVGESVSVMASFWLGTVPALVIGTRLFAVVMGPIQRYSAQLQAILLIGVGLVTIGHKLQCVTFTHDESNQIFIRCHYPSSNIQLR